MPIAYVTDTGAVLSLRGRRLEIRREGGTLAAWSLGRLRGLCLRGPVHLTTPAMQTLLHAGIGVVLLSSRGRLLGSLQPPTGHHPELRLQQYRLHEDAGRRIELARSLVSTKIHNAREVVLRFQRNHPGQDLSAEAQSLDDAAEAVAKAESPSSLVGVEGHAGRIYFRCLRQMCQANLAFSGRTTRPPRDPVNALLSLAYAFLGNELLILLTAMGLDPHIGFFHTTNFSRPSLALDLLEPFRAGLMDRLALYLINNGMLRLEHFEQSDGAWQLSRQGFQLFAREYEALLLRRRVDALTGRKETYRRHLQLQVERYASSLAHAKIPPWFRLDK